MIKKNTDITRDNSTISRFFGEHLKLDNEEKRYMREECKKYCEWKERFYRFLLGKLFGD